MHADVLSGLEDEVREQVRRRGLDPATDAAAVRSLVADIVGRHHDRAPTVAPDTDIESLCRDLYDAVVGFGPLQRLLDDPTVEEVWINDPAHVFVARGGRSELTTVMLTAEQVRELVERMLKSSGRRVDLSQPFVDAALPDGSRLHVAIPDATRRFWAVNSAQPMSSTPTMVGLTCDFACLEVGGTCR